MTRRYGFRVEPRQAPAVGRPWHSRERRRSRSARLSSEGLGWCVTLTEGLARACVAGGLVFLVLVFFSRVCASAAVKHSARPADSNSGAQRALALAGGVVAGGAGGGGMDIGGLGMGGGWQGTGRGPPRCHHFLHPAMRNTVLNLEESLIREVANAGLGRDDLLAFSFCESHTATPPPGGPCGGGEGFRPGGARLFPRTPGGGGRCARRWPIPWVACTARWGPSGSRGLAGAGRRRCCPRTPLSLPAIKSFPSTPR